MIMDRVVSVRKVLEVAAEFDDYGVSCEFVAWELCERVTAIRPPWREATGGGLIEPFGRDGITHEPLWRLTARGREELNLPLGTEYSR
jgi:hypothetical protein